MNRKQTRAVREIMASTGLVYTEAFLFNRLKQEGRMGEWITDLLPSMAVQWLDLFEPHMPLQVAWSTTFNRPVFTVIECPDVTFTVGGFTGPDEARLVIPAEAVSITMHSDTTGAQAVFWRKGRDIAGWVSHSMEEIMDFVSHNAEPCIEAWTALTEAGVVSASTKPLVLKGFLPQRLLPWLDPVKELGGRFRPTSTVLVKDDDCIFVFGGVRNGKGSGLHQGEGNAYGWMLSLRSPRTAASSGTFSLAEDESLVEVLKRIKVRELKTLSDHPYSPAIKLGA